MKKGIITSIAFIFMAFIISVNPSFADNATNASITSSEFLAMSNESGTITLNEDTTLTDALKVDAKNLVIDLNGHTLKFTKDTNLFVNNSNIIFKNGTINLDGIKGSADCILGVGHYGSSAILTLDNVNLQAKNYKSPYALIYVYGNSTLNIENNSTLNVKNEMSLSGGVIKTNSGEAGKINIANSTLNFENTARGFLDGTINMKNSSVSMKGLSNGINSTNGGLNLTVDNSNLTISGCIGRALTIDNSEVNIINGSNIDFNKSLAGDIKFNSQGSVKVDKSSKLNVDKITFANGVNSEDLDKLIVAEGQDFNVNADGTVTKTCKHINEVKVNEKEATCTEEGYTGDIVCADCNESIEIGTIIPKVEHNFENGTCTNCDELDPSFKPETEVPGNEEVPGDIEKPETEVPDNEEVQEDVVKPETENNSDNQTDAPQTGDDTNLYVMFGMVVISIVGLVYVRKAIAK